MSERFAFPLRGRVYCRAQWWVPFPSGEAEGLPPDGVLGSPARGAVEQYFVRLRGWEKDYLNSITTPQSFEKRTRHFSKSSSPYTGEPSCALWDGELPHTILPSP